MNLVDFEREEILSSKQIEVYARVRQFDIQEPLPDQEVMGIFRGVLRYKEAKKEELESYILDPVTGLPGRNLYDKEVAALHARFMRDQATNSYALALWDVDNLKQVNDTFGHKAGDKYLQAVVRGINSSLREGDLLFKVGGDEFAGIFFGVSEESVVEPIFQRIDKSLNAAIAILKENESWPGMNLGVSTGHALPQLGEGLLDIETIVDQRMYENKRARKQEKGREISAPILGVQKLFGRIAVRYEPPGEQTPLIKT